MNKTYFKLDKSAVKSEILQAEWMKDYIDKVAKSEHRPNTHVKSFIGYNRAISIFYKDTKEHPS